MTRPDLLFQFWIEVSVLNRLKKSITTSLFCFILFLKVKLCYTGHSLHLKDFQRRETLPESFVDYNGEGNCFANFSVIEISKIPENIKKTWKIFFFYKRRIIRRQRNSVWDHYVKGLSNYMTRFALLLSCLQLRLLWNRFKIHLEQENFCWTKIHILAFYLLCCGSRVLRCTPEKRILSCSKIRKWNQKRCRSFEWSGTAVHFEEACFTHGTNLRFYFSEKHGSLNVFCVLTVNAKEGVVRKG